LMFDENGVYIYKRLSKITDYSTPVREFETRGMFECAGEKLSRFFTASLSTKNSKFYLPVYNNPSASSDSYHQFDITYCHISGSGSSYTQDGVDILPAKTMYRKYMLECFGSNQGKFRFKNNANGDYFYVIHLDRYCFQNGIDVGNFQLGLMPLSSSINQLVNTGSGYSADVSSSQLFTLIDNSNDIKQGVIEREEIQDFYYLVSGSLSNGIYDEPDQNAWGVVFPKAGVIILDGVVLDQSCSFNTVTASIDGDNIRKLFVSVSGSSTVTHGRSRTQDFFGRSVDEKLVETYFCRLEPDEYNYSTNYTYVSGSEGFLQYNYFAKNPMSYITSIGLYNNNRQLLAVGKLKTPLKKDSNTSYIFHVNVRLN